MNLLKELQDQEWEADWKRITRLFGIIDSLKSLFKQMDVSYLREVQQKVLVLNLKKYAWSLQNYIIEKYTSERV